MKTRYFLLTCTFLSCLLIAPLDAQTLKQQVPKKPVWPDRMPIVQGDTTLDRHMPMYPHQKGTDEDLLQNFLPQDFVSVDKQPVPTIRVNPVYPDSARRSGIEGTVWVKALVDTDGTVGKAVVMRSDNEIFNGAAINAILQWKFVPAIDKGKYVRVWVSVPFRFKLGPKK